MKEQVNEEIYPTESKINNCKLCLEQDDNLISTNHYCNTCEIYLCEEHVKLHQRSNKTKNHNILLKNINNYYCNIHLNQKLIIFCKDCNKLICPLCGYLIEHFNHCKQLLDQEFIFEQVKYLQNINDKLQKLKINLENKFNENEELNLNFKNNFKEIENNLNLNFEEIYLKLNERKEFLQKQINKVYNERLNLINENKNNLLEKINNLNNFLNLTNNLQKQNEIDIMFTKLKFENIFNENINDNLINNLNKINNFEIEFNKNKLIENINEFGNINDFKINLKLSEIFNFKNYFYLNEKIQLILQLKNDFGNLIIKNKYKINAFITNKENYKISNLDIYFDKEKGNYILEFKCLQHFGNKCYLNIFIENELFFVKQFQIIYQNNLDFNLIDKINLDKFNCQYCWDIKLNNDFIFITDYNNCRILIIDKFTKNLNKIISTKSNPRCLCLDNFTIFVTCNDHCIYKYNYLNGNELQKIENKSLNNILGITIDNNYIYVCDANHHQIKMLEKESGNLLDEIGTRGYQPLQFNYPYGIIFDNDLNQLYVTEDNHRIQIIKENKSISQFGKFGKEIEEFNNPRGITIDKNHLFVCDRSNNRIQVFNKKGKFIKNFENKLNRP
ncbi:hypothetical protein ABK040_005426 [Willaertia magna]